MSIAVELPALGESVLEGTVSRWLVSEGDYVETDQPIVEVTTDKVDAEIPAPTNGVIEKILANEGETIEVGAPLATIDETASAGDAPAASRPAPEPPSMPAPSSAAPSSAAPSAAAPSAPAPPAEVAPPPPMAEGGPTATPVARRIAEEANLDLGQVTGTGSAGRITKSDVLQATVAPAPAAQAPSAPAAAPQRAPAPARKAAGRPAFASYELQEGDQVIPMTPQRRLIAEHMVYSKRTSPHVGTVAEIDMTGVANLRARNKARFQETHGVSLTYLPFIVQAAVRALRDNPRLNASVVEDAIVEKRAIHIGMAVETEKGLVAPVLRNADRLSLAGIALAIDDLGTRARNKKLSADELRGGTFTVSNPGRKGNLYGFAIINQPQVGILRVGELVKRPVVRTVEGEDVIVIRQMMHLALSYDHRAVDGQPANAFLFQVRELLEAADFEV